MDRFWAKVDRTGECWLWTGSRNSDGYGQFWFDGGSRKAHRVAYELIVGPIPPGRVIDHLCGNPACVNPAHMEPVERVENVRRGRAWMLSRERTHCVAGHPLDGDNLYVTPDGRRMCRECGRRRSREHYQRRRAGAST